MKKSLIALVIIVTTSSAIAEVVTLECKGANAAGAKENVVVRYDETVGWVDDNGIIKIRDGVSAKDLTGFTVIIDRQTGKYRTNRPTSPDKDFRGTCEKMARKF